MWGRSTSGLDAAAAAAIAAILDPPKYELIPLGNVHRQVEFLPEGATVSVTASPAKGLDATIDLTLKLADLGFDVIPHLSARMVRDRGHLAEVMVRLEAREVRRAFVVAGDAEEPGDFFDGLALLEAMEESGHGLAEIGIPCYPEGHSFISDDKLAQALRDKQRFASYMTTQMCFDPDAITSWIAGARADGIELPVHVGLPGVAPLLKLASISARIGIGESVRFITRQKGLLGKLVRPGGYAPDQLIAALGEAIVDEDAGIAGFHVYTFNQVETTEAWRQEFLADLSAD